MPIQPVPWPLRIAQVAPPFERVPPAGYGGTERVIDELSRELARRGHEIVLFASGDSSSPGRLVPTVPQPLRNRGPEADPVPAFLRTLQLVLAHEDEVDIVHAHLDFWNLPLARAARMPVVSSFHGRLDLPHAAAALRHHRGGLVALSRSQAAQVPDAAWLGVVHNGMTLGNQPFVAHPSEDLCFVGRISPEKGVVAAIEVARLSGRRLLIAAKAPYLASEREYYEEVYRPALARADVEEMGELGGDERDQLMARSFATLMPSDWPEPFGLTAIESLACGTPVIARPVGALPEIIRPGRDGFFGDDARDMANRLASVPGLDRAAIRREVVERFSAERMADGYEAVYRRVLAETPATRAQGTRVAVAEPSREVSARRMPPCSGSR